MNRVTPMLSFMMVVFWRLGGLNVTIILNRQDAENAKEFSENKSSSCNGGFVSLIHSTIASTLVN